MKMTKSIVAICLAIIFIFSFSFKSSAHPGSTDAYGGHYDRSTGEYHYHHGYPAHSHSNGCPYNYDDKTNHDSSSSSQSNGNNNDDNHQLTIEDGIRIVLASLCVSLLCTLYVYPIIGLLLVYLIDKFSSNGIESSLEDKIMKLSRKVGFVLGFILIAIILYFNS